MPCPMWLWATLWWCAAYLDTGVPHSTRDLRACTCSLHVCHTHCVGSWAMITREHVTAGTEACMFAVTHRRALAGAGRVPGRRIPVEVPGHNRVSGGAIWGGVSRLPGVVWRQQHLCAPRHCFRVTCATLFRYIVCLATQGHAWGLLLLRSLQRAASLPHQLCTKRMLCKAQLAKAMQADLSCAALQSCNSGL